MRRDIEEAYAVLCAGRSANSYMAETAACAPRSMCRIRHPTARSSDEVPGVSGGGRRLRPSSMRPAEVSSQNARAAVDGPQSRCRRRRPSSLDRHHENRHVSGLRRRVTAVFVPNARRAGRWTDDHAPGPVDSAGPDGGGPWPRGTRPGPARARRAGRAARGRAGNRHRRPSPAGAARDDRPRRRAGDHARHPAAGGNPRRRAARRAGLRRPCPRCPISSSSFPTRAPPPPSAPRPG